MVRPEAIVKFEEIKLGDIATFGTAEKEFEELVAQLKNIKLCDAPAPKTKVIILGATILEKIAFEGVPKEAIGYSIPRSVTVERDGRIITRDEVLSSIKQELWKLKNADLQVRDVEWANSQVIPVGESTVKTEILGEAVSGKLPVRVEIHVDSKPAARFLATGIADDWKEVPVLNRVVDRGGVIASEDIQLVRTNLSQYPADAISGLNELIGKRARGRLQAGEVVRRSNIDIPPIIPKGKKIAIVFEKGFLRATATGVALEDGFQGAKINIRNEGSKKIVVGKVVSSELTEVTDGL
jgi:flagella basal body P-ring formation protein FlgA